VTADNKRLTANSFDVSQSITTLLSRRVVTTGRKIYMQRVSNPSAIAGDADAK